MSSMAMLSGAATTPAGPGQPDMSKLYKAEVDNLALADGMYKYAGDGVEERILKLFGKEVGGESKKDR